MLLYVHYWVHRVSHIYVTSAITFVEFVIFNNFTIKSNGSRHFFLLLGFKFLSFRFYSTVLWKKSEYPFYQREFEKKPFVLFVTLTRWFWTSIWVNENSYTFLCLHYMILWRSHFTFHWSLKYKHTVFFFQILTNFKHLYKINALIFIRTNEHCHFFC